MPEPTLGLVMILRDEAANLPRSLAPVAALFDEVVVADTGSGDRTVDICRSLGARVHSFAWVDDFAAARNSTLEQATADWLLWLDGDNAMAPGGVAALREAIAQGGPAVIWALERVVPSGESLWQKRCFPRHPQARFRGRVHEQLEHPAHWPSRFSPVVIEHWGYHTPELVRAKGEFYRRLLAGEAVDFYTRFQLARCHLNLGDQEAARAELVALVADPAARERNPAVWAWGVGRLARLLRRQGRHAEARTSLEAALALAPDLGLLHYHQGRQAWDSGDWDRAAHHLGRALELGWGGAAVDQNPRRLSYSAAYYLGLALARASRWRPAREALAQAAGLEPDNPAPWGELAQLELDAGRPAEARRALERLLALSPEDRRARALWAQCGGAA